MPLRGFEANYVSYSPETDPVFTISIPQVVKFGFGVAREVGFEAKRLGLRRVALVVGRRLAETRLAEEVRSSLEEAGVSVKVVTKVKIEPDDEAVMEAYREIKDERLDGFVALGGGSTIDTAKMLNLLHTYPRPLEDYINRPVGKGLSPPGPLKPLIAIPTTAGTGSESTNVAVVDVVRLKVKTGISNPYMRPTVALIDPLTTITMPPMVTASSGLDVLNHAIESFTSHPYTSKPRIEDPSQRPVYSGATPLGDLFGAQAIVWVDRYLRRAYADPLDLEARYYMMLAASIAGLGFGHVGVHVPHAMAYPIAGMVREYYPPDYEFGYPIVPHGIATSIPAGYAFKRLTAYNFPKFREIVKLVKGVEVATPREAGEELFDYYMKLLEDLRVPTSLREIGYKEGDLEALVDGTLKQQRLLTLSPKRISKRDLEEIFKDALG
ncbi:MAG: iron-containing alcohol dehydrogenase [Desulfurococcales archaeon]|nr:iron-containing alcohol dehydrogenase [Desulfurococcales archaeon]